jgi:hypothetical protein
MSCTLINIMLAELDSGGHVQGHRLLVLAGLGTAAAGELVIAVQVGPLKKSVVNAGASSGSTQVLGVKRLFSLIGFPQSQGSRKVEASPPQELTVCFLRTRAFRKPSTLRCLQAR